MIHGGKERPPAPKIIKIAPHPRPQSISAGISISTTPIVLSTMITPNNKPAKTTIAQLFSQQQLQQQQQQQQQQPPKLNATQRRSESVQSKQPTIVAQKTVTPQPTSQTQSKPRPQETQTPQQVVKKLSVGAPTLATTTTTNPAPTTTTSAVETKTTKPTPAKAPTPTPSMTTTSTTKSQNTKKASSTITNTNTPISTNKPTPIKTASIKPTTATTTTTTTTKTTKAAAMAMIPANQNVCRYFTEDVSVSETTDITDVTAKSHSINSYSTSLQAEIGSGCQGHFGANSSNAAAAAYRYHRHHLNLDTSMIREFFKFIKPRSKSFNKLLGVKVLEF